MHKYSCALRVSEWVSGTFTTPHAQLKLLVRLEMLCTALPVLFIWHMKAILRLRESHHAITVLRVGSRISGFLCTIMRLWAMHYFWWKVLLLFKNPEPIFGRFFQPFRLLSQFTNFSFNCFLLLLYIKWGNAANIWCSENTKIYE